MAVGSFSLIAALVIIAVSCASVGDAFRSGYAAQSAGHKEESVEQPPDAGALLNRAIALAKAHRYDEATADLDAAIAISPHGPRAHLYRGVISGIRGDYEQAAADHLTALKVELLSPEDAAIEHEQWRSSITMWAIYLRSGDFDKAIEDYDTLTSLSPDEADAYMWRGCAYYLKGEVNIAIVDYDKAIALTPGNALALYKRGLAHARLANSSQANQDFARAMAIGFHEEAGESNKAGQQSQGGSQNLSEHGQGIFHYDRALDRLTQADYDNAVADIDKARKLIDPQLIHLYTDEMHRVYFQSGIAYYDTGLYDQAALLFDKAINVVASPSGYPDAYYWRGMSHYREVRYRQAIADFDMVITIEKDYPDAAHYRQLSEDSLPR